MCECSSPFPWCVWLGTGAGQVHGAPLGADDIAHVKTKLGLDPTQTFHVSEDVSAPLHPSPHTDTHTSPLRM